MNLPYFIGSAKTAIDGKGRSSFPRELRRQLWPTEGTEFVVARGPDHTLRLYMLPEYVKFMAEIDAFKDRRQADKFRKQLDASLVEMDGQNRILIPKKLLDYAGLTTEVVYTPGRGRSLEMWNPERFNAQTSMKTDEDQQSFNDIYYQIGSSEGLDDKR